MTNAHALGECKCNDSVRKDLLCQFYEDGMRKKEHAPVVRFVFIRLSNIVQFLYEFGIVLDRHSFTLDF